MEEKNLFLWQCVPNTTVSGSSKALTSLSKHLMEELKRNEKYEDFIGPYPVMSVQSNLLLLMFFSSRILSVVSVLPQQWQRELWALAVELP